MATLLIAVMAVVPLVGLSTSTVSATAPSYMYVRFPDDGTFGSVRIYFVDDVDGEAVTTGPIDGWCAAKETYIYVNTPYPYTSYNYYAGDTLPEWVQYNKDNGFERDWNRITYIMNHYTEYGATDNDVQQAVWYYTGDLDYGDLSSKAQDMIDGAAGYGEYVPPVGGWEPVILDMGVCVQIIFYLNPPVQPVPEMPPVVLFGAGMLGLGGFVWYRKRRALAA